MSIKLKAQQLTLLFLRNRHFLNLAFSQEGEDLVLARKFEGKPNGFFVDVGAHHPIRLSNTYKFYLKGWRGINIDAMPGRLMSKGWMQRCWNQTTGHCSGHILS